MEIDADQAGASQAKDYREEDAHAVAGYHCRSLPNRRHDPGESLRWSTPDLTADCDSVKLPRERMTPGAQATV
jgi:hypothetical protein